MALTNELTEATASTTRKIVILGKHGVGKTSLIKSLPKDDVIIIDFENGLLPLAGLGYKSVSPTISKMKEYIAEIGKGGPGITGKTVVIDSVSEMTAVFLEEAKRLMPRNNMQAYGVMIDEVSKIFRAIMKQNNCDVVLLGAIEQRTVNDAEGQMEVERPMIDTARLAGRLVFAFDGVFCLLDQRGDRKIYTSGALSGGLRCKDRSGTLERIEEPNLQTILTKMKSASVKWQKRELAEEAATIAAEEAATLAASKKAS